MNIRKTFQGAYEISALVKDEYGDEYLMTRQYLYYTRREAIREFRQDRKDEKELAQLKAEVRKDHATPEYKQEQEWWANRSKE
jgi:hypothetical protein